MKFLFVNLDWSGLVSKKTFKIHFTLPPLDLLLLHNSLLPRSGSQPGSIADNSTAFNRDKGGLGHQGEIFDCFVDNIELLPEKVRSADWIIITTTPYHMWQCPNAEWENIVLALKNFPAQKVILVGLHASVFPESTLRETGVHAVIRREPEVVFRSFLESNDWRATNGVSYLNGTTYQENPLPKLPPMDELVVTDYCVDIDKYAYFLLGKKTGVFEASRGCPWKCTFCDQEMYSWKYRTKSAAVFADEVANAVARTGMKTAYFYDLEFTIQEKRTLEMCEELKSRGIHKKIKWACQTRADMVSETMLDAMKSAGCTLIHFGVESANPQILKETNKKITLDKIQEGVGLTKRKGIQSACFFMFGLPGEKPEEFENTLEFARKLNPTYASFHFAVPFPGTPLYTRYLEEKQLPWGSWPSTYFDGWAHKDIAAYISRAFKRFYLTPRRFEVQEFMFRLNNLPQKLAYFRSVH